MKRKSLLWNILMSSIGILIVVLTIVCLVFSFNVNKYYTSSIKSNLYHTVATESAKMDAWFTKHTAIAQSFAQTALNQDLHGEELQKYIINSVLPCSQNIMDGYLAWESDETGMVCAIFPVDDDYVAKERDWYIRAKSTGETIITEPYIDVATGNIVITVAAPLKSAKGVEGVCGLDIEVTELLTLTRELRADKTGYAVLVDNNDNIVVHSKNPNFSHRLEDDKEVITRLIDIAPIYTKVLAASGSANVVSGNGFDGTKRYFPVVPIGETGWKVLYAADFAKTMSPLRNLMILAIIVSVAAIIGGAIFFYLKFTKRLKPLTSIAGIVTSMSNGTLEHEYPSTVNDEIGIICEDLNMTNNSLKSYINEIGRIISNMADGNFNYDSDICFVGEFASVGESLRSICNTMQTTFGQLRNVSKQLSEGSYSVSAGAVKLAEAVRDETSLIKDVHDNLEDINNRVSLSSQNAFNVKQQVLNNAEKLDESNNKMHELTNIMNIISNFTTEIVKINSTIENIASQTNILALNASVEAARAGAAGRGFAVVADDVRNLAIKSSEAANSTAALIDQTVQSIKSGTIVANAAAEMLSEIVSETNSISESVSEIATVSEEQKSMLTQIVNNLGEVGTLIRANESTAQNAANSSEKLDNQIIQLNKSLERYK